MIELFQFRSKSGFFNRSYMKLMCQNLNISIKLFNEVNHNARVLTEILYDLFHSTDYTRQIQFCCILQQISPLRAGQVCILSPRVTFLPSGFSLTLSFHLKNKSPSWTSEVLSFPRWG